VKITSRGEKLGRWIEGNPIIILTIAALFTVGAVHYAQNITMESGTDTYVDENSRLYMTYDHLFSDKFGTESIVVLVEGDVVTSSESLKAMDRLTRQMETVENVLGTTSIAEMVMEAEAEETGVRRVPDSQARIDEILKGLEVTNPAMLTAILPDRGHTMISIELPIYLSDDSTTAILLEIYSAVDVAEFPSGADTIVTGDIPLHHDMEEEMNASMVTLLVIACLLMVVALLLVFRHVHLPLLPRL